MTLLHLFKFDLIHQFQAVSFLDPFVCPKVQFSEYQTASTAVHIFELLT